MYKKNLSEYFFFHLFKGLIRTRESPKVNGETYLIGNFKIFEDAREFLEWKLNYFETLNVRVIRHTERTSMEAIFID